MTVTSRSKITVSAVFHRQFIRWQLFSNGADRDETFLRYNILPHSFV